MIFASITNLDELRDSAKLLQDRVTEDQGGFRGELSQQEAEDLLETHLHLIDHVASLQRKLARVVSCR